MEGVWIGLTDTMLEFFNYPAVTEAFVDILVCAVPIWVAVMIGLLIGWSWRPRWAGLVFLGFRSKLRYVWTLPPGLGARRFWLAFTALSAFSLCRGIWFRSRGLSRKLGKSSARELADSAQELAGDAREAAAVGDSGISLTKSISMETITGDSDAELNSVTDKDLEHLLHLLDGKEGELAWQSMMERSTSNMMYQAWRHEPEVGPTVYRSKTIFEDATPEMVRDFFWDDEFRPKWDPMLVYVKILEECPETGMMIVHWIKKFPFFCSDREYIIGRRIWEGVRTYYCVTKGVPYPSLPRRDKPRRVDLYFSSWVIKPAQSRRGDSQSSSACEVTLIHYEDMGIPKDVAKLGVRHGMWGTVKKLHAGFRAYQNSQKSETSLSRCALNARVTTRVSFDQESDDGGDGAISGREGGELEAADGKNKVGDGGSVGIDWKWVAVGGAIAVVCGLHTGLIGKAVVVGVGHRIARRRGITRSR
ncbi:Polyketide cyclase/dehydrase and lipid transport superfamily protein [Striga hermonthica]|uniref:Polyketide cyclase/dehydrase and lipid transport superfamily protein n=1 Tax=Striga hermonthica TaxID=68872 RepID=A0A9N7MTY3_STRHE|nr:Polyketide cyclase/dehydrase and lipid transport superfamily protein [Striga hermonthica]